MKLLMIVYDSGIEEDMVALTKALDLPGYTKVTGASGLGGAGHKLGDPIWPGTNNVLYVALPDDQVGGVIQALAELKATFRKNPGITPFVLSLEGIPVAATNNTEVSASGNESKDTT